MENSVESDGYRTRFSAGMKEYVSGMMDGGSSSGIRAS
jgi:hypothetical protein